MLKQTRQKCLKRRLIMQRETIKQQKCRTQLQQRKISKAKNFVVNTRSKRPLTTDSEVKDNTPGRPKKARLERNVDKQMIDGSFH